jgi:maltokinase
MSRVESLSSDELLGLVVGRRWFASKEREPEGAHVSAVVHADDDLELALVEVRFLEGTHDTYLLALAFDEDGPADALDRPGSMRRLAALCGVDTPCASVRPMGVEQSNSSVVLDELHVVKLYRRLEAGPNPELELLRVLQQAGFANSPGLTGWLEHRGDPLDAVLAVVTRLVDSAGGGWELTLDALGSGEPDWLPRRAHRLGEVTGAMHAVLAAVDDPSLAPEQPSAEAVGLLAATIDEDISRLSVDMPGLAGTPLALRLEAVRDLVQELGHVGPPGLVSRVHGDYHLGQVLWTRAGDWVVIDFEGEPARSLAERRRRSSPLRDVAGMLRSFAYVPRAVALLRGVEAPEEWEWSCRAAFLDGWRSTVDPRVLPASESGFDRLLELFELQRLLYELRYELGNRPDWVSIPVDGIERLLEAR